jgi:hypothetical protein
VKEKFFMASVMLSLEPAGKYSYFPNLFPHIKHFTLFITGRDDSKSNRIRKEGRGIISY